MRKINTHNKMINFLLFLFCIYFFTYLLFASIETISSRIKSRGLLEDRFKVINLLSGFILSEMPIEDRDKWNDFFKNSQDFIFISSQESKLLSYDSAGDNISMNRYVPLSILLF